MFSLGLMPRVFIACCPATVVRSRRPARSKWALSRTLVVGLAAALAVVLGMGGRIDAGTIKISAYTSNLSIGTSSLYARNISGATDGYDAYPTDSLFASSPYSNALEIYTIVEGNKLSTDARPIDTLGWDFFLGVKGSATCDNSIKFKTIDSTDLTIRPIVAYDIASPSTKYQIPADGSILTIPLPSLVNETRNPYAYWKLYIAMPGDCNLDGTVNGSDLNTVLSNYNQSGQDWPHGDFNGDGTVNGSDLNVVLSSYNQSYAAGAAVPEPGTTAILIVGAVVATYRLRARGHVRRAYHKRSETSIG
jgi:hypothetical protein